MSGWAEVADGVFQRRYDPWDISVCVVRGSEGLLVVDTRASARQADEVRADLRELGPRPVVGVVNTHAHFDHTFGNQRFTAVPIYGHEQVPAHLDAHERPMLADWVARREEPADEWAEVVITTPTVLVGDEHRIVLGDRVVETLHLGRGHTDNDIVLHVPEAAAWVVGDLVEESGPPMYGSGCFPLEWPGTCARLAGLLSPTDVVVPGHGSPVDRAFVVEQQGRLAEVADLISELHGAGVPAGQARAAGGTRWALEQDGLDQAIAAGYAALASGAPGQPSTSSR
jgi:glyoxylase-like metal-dependent hydrolase (beta-lactamase superfamily II)